MEKRPKKAMYYISHSYRMFVNVRYTGCVFTSTGPIAISPWPWNVLINWVFIVPNTRKLLLVPDNELIWWKLCMNSSQGIVLLIEFNLFSGADIVWLKFNVTVIYCQVGWCIFSSKISIYFFNRLVLRHTFKRSN